MEVKY